MKHINKSSSPATFETWKTAFFAKHGRKPLYTDLIGEPKQILKNNLIQEQFSLCCYCCNRVEQYLNSHIEHLKPKGNALYSGLQLEYSNLFVSCDGVKHSRQNCGHKKDNWYDDHYMVSPLEENCETFFSFSAEGSISESDGNPRAKETITQLDLNSSLLVRARKTAIHLSGFFDDDFIEKKDIYITQFETPVDGELEPFCNAVLYCMKNY